MSRFTQQERETLLATVDTALEFGFGHHRQLHVELAKYSERLQELGASFVTLKYKGQLRGCIGTLEAYQPLIQDVASNAHNAAFRDPRFMPLTNAEYPYLTKQISILSSSTPLSFTSEKDLLQQLHPGIDGLILSEQGYRSTFLPAVWEELPQPQVFLQHLKTKAGLTHDYWSDTLQIERYTVEVVE